MQEKLKLLLAALLVVGVSASARAAKADAPLLVLNPALSQAGDYDSVLKAASKAKASLVLLPLRRADGHEGAFELAELAQKSGLFAKVSVGDDLGTADYAITGTWDTWTRHAGARHVVGLGRWMWSGCEVKLDLLHEGARFQAFAPGRLETELYLNPPFTPLLLAQAAREALHQTYRQALYLIAKDILKRSGR